ncbi:ABC transporter substrate-binding protein [Anaeropeptidivorans aminofermentans]|uniref:ABC transporter substrate-binding protein n=1 Tax=Anaeropeptidivorans aminofermentans TaxID=2934315 RepID=UPI002024489D|nr:ABC transporter substrate-binding protein [Anaeropeptidivorans aminofermentans]
MKNKTLKCLKCMLLVTIIPFIFASCNPPKEANIPPDALEETEASQAPVEIASGEWIRAGIKYDPSSLAPYENNTPEIASMMYNGLFKLNTFLEPEPDLIAEYSENDNGQWAFTLKEGIKFHNGNPLRSEDVKATLDLVKKLPGTYAYTDAIGEISVIDELHFTISAKESSSSLPYYLSATACYILPKELIEGSHDFGSAPIGTGPYSLTEYKKGESITFTAFEDYFDAENKPQIKNAEIKFIYDDNYRALALKTGEIDYLYDTPTESLNLIKDDKDIVILETKGIHLTTLLMNNENPPFDYIPFRKAIHSLIDKEGISIVASGGSADIPSSQIPIIYETSLMNNDTFYYNPQEAAKFIAESEIDISQLNLEILCSGEIAEKIAQIVQSDLASAGISTTIRNLDYAAYLDLVLRGDYTLAINERSFPHIFSFLKSGFASSSIGGSNFVRYSNEDFDNALKEASNAFNEAAKIDAIKKASEILDSTSPAVPIYISKIHHAYHKDLDGVKASPSGILYINNMRWK